MIGQQILCLRLPGARRCLRIDDDHNTGDGELARDGGTRSGDLVGAVGDVVGRGSARLIGIDALKTSVVGAIREIDRTQALGDLRRRAGGGLLPSVTVKACGQGSIAWNAATFERRAHP